MSNRLPRLLVTISLLASILTFADPVTPTANAVAIGSGNCQSDFTQTSGTFTVSDSFQSGNNCTLIFKTNANSNTATGTWAVPYSSTSITYLVVGGGGSGSRGTCSYTYGPGGGGGAVITGTNTFSGTLNITVGRGGLNSASGCPNTAGSGGQDSVFHNLTANGGGAAGTGKIGGTS